MLPPLCVGAGVQSRREGACAPPLSAPLSGHVSHALPPSWLVPGAQPWRWAHICLLYRLNKKVFYSVCNLYLLIINISFSSSDKEATFKKKRCLGGVSNLGCFQADQSVRTLQKVATY